MKATCFCCEKPVTEGYIMVAFDRPYINLFFHKDCYLSLNCEVDELVNKESVRFANFLSDFKSKGKK